MERKSAEETLLAEFKWVRIDEPLSKYDKTQIKEAAIKAIKSYASQAVRLALESAGVQADINFHQGCTVREIRENINSLEKEIIGKLK